jgi:hypothetical protein
MSSGSFQFDPRRRENLIPLSVAASIHEFPQGNLKPRVDGESTRRADVFVDGERVAVDVDRAGKRGPCPATGPAPIRSFQVLHPTGRPCAHPLAEREATSV